MNVALIGVQQTIHIQGYGRSYIVPLLQQNKGYGLSLELLPLNDDR